MEQKQHTREAVLFILQRHLQLCIVRLPCFTVHQCIIRLDSMHSMSGGIGTGCHRRSMLTSFRIEVLLATLGALLKDHDAKHVTIQRLDDHTEWDPKNAWEGLSPVADTTWSNSPADRVQT
jgi:hypothetical protein